MTTVMLLPSVRTTLTLASAEANESATSTSTGNKVVRVPWRKHSFPHFLLETRPVHLLI